MQTKKQLMNTSHILIFFLVYKKKKDLIAKMIIKISPSSNKIVQLSLKIVTKIVTQTLKLRVKGAFKNICRGAIGIYKYVRMGISSSCILPWTLHNYRKLEGWCTKLMQGRIARPSLPVSSFPHSLSILLLLWLPALFCTAPQQSVHITASDQTPALLVELWSEQFSCQPFIYKDSYTLLKTEINQQ